jgi:hypothetical protein
MMTKIEPEFSAKAINVEDTADGIEIFEEKLKMKVFGCSIESRGEWVLYESIGERIQQTCRPLTLQYPQLNAGKLRDLNDIVSESRDMESAIYYVASIVSFLEDKAEVAIDLILNAIYPATNKLNYFSVEFLNDFITYCETEKFSSQERKIAMDRVICGEDYKTIKFEKIDASETINAVNEALKDVNFEDIKKKPSLINYYVGKVMKATKGKVNVAQVKHLIEDKVKYDKSN